MRTAYPVVLTAILALMISTTAVAASEAATIKSELQQNTGHITCKDGTKHNINEFYIDAKTNGEGKLTGKFGLGQSSQGADMKIDEGTFSANNYEFKSSAEDWSVGCNDTFNTKGTLKGSCGDAASIEYTSALGTTYSVKGKVTCTQ